MSPHTSCVHCPHVADEHSGSGVCLAFEGNSARPCRCLRFARVETLYGIADEADLITTIPTDVLLAALVIAAVQIGDSHDDELSAYGVGIATAQERDRFTTAIKTTLHDLEAAGA